MHGNVGEWCEDWFDDYENLPSFTDPVRDVESGLGKVMRGASWMHAAISCRSAWRGGTYPYNMYSSFGVRVVFPAVQN
jgi:formylglycine-generating enzyme required for sulfatase activity